LPGLGVAIPARPPELGAREHLVGERRGWGAVARRGVMASASDCTVAVASSSAWLAWPSARASSAASAWARAASQ
jgi:hypothetical protein